MKSQKGSLILSLVAAGSVAAAIVATHQVAQVFSEGAGQKFSQERAFRSAQKNLALAVLMVNRGIIACSARRITSAEDITGSKVGRFEGCRLTKKSDQKLQSTKDLYDPKPKGLDLNALNTRSASFFTSKNNDSGGKYEGLKNVIFNEEDSDGNHDNHAVFKLSKITWAVKGSEDPTVKSAFSSLSKGYICWEKGSFKVKEDGVCPNPPSNPPDERFHSTESHRFNKEQKIENILVKQENCEVNGSVDSNTVCDYYSLSDYDQGLVFISVEVPYGEASEKNNVVMNALVRRPPAIVKIFQGEGGFCPMMCEPSEKSNLLSTDSEQTAQKIDPFPRCTTMGHAAYFRTRPTPSGPVEKVGGLDYRYREGTLLGPSYLKVKNYGPGPLYDLVLKREDIDNSTNSVISHQILSNTSFRFENNGELLPGDETVLRDWVPCYRSHYYSKNIKKVSCSYRMNRFSNSDLPGNAAAKVCKDGVNCGDKTDMDDVATHCRGTHSIIRGTKNSTKGDILHDDLAIKAFSEDLEDQVHREVKNLKFPKLANSVRTVFRDTSTEHCRARPGNSKVETTDNKGRTYTTNTCVRGGNPDPKIDRTSAMHVGKARPAQTDGWMKRRRRY